MPDPLLGRLGRRFSKYSASPKRTSLLCWTVCCVLRRGDVALVLKRMGVQPPDRLGDPMLPPELLGMLGVTFDVFRLPIQKCVLYRTVSSGLLSSTPTSYRHIPNPGPGVSQSPGCVTDSRKNCQTPNSVDSSKLTWARLEATRKDMGPHAGTQ